MAVVLTGVGGESTGGEKLWWDTGLAVWRFECEVPIRRQAAFGRLLSQFRGLGFRLEEADRMNFKLVMDRGSILGSLFGGAVSFRRVWMRANVERRGADRAFITISFTGWGKAVDGEARTAYAAEIRRFERSAEEAAEEATMGRATTGAAEPAVVREVVIKEVVRIPCKFCGSLVDNTARKCLDCGAPLT